MAHSRFERGDLCLQAASVSWRPPMRFMSYKGYLPRGVRSRGGGRPQVHDRLWMDFSFVASSGYRERVVSALASAPKLPRQVAQDTDLRSTHVSRALRELSSRGLVECLTPSAKSHGRLYALTEPGASLVAYRQNSSRRFSHVGRDLRNLGFVPKIRAAAIIRALQFLKAARGASALKEALKDWSVNPDELTEDAWMSADAFDEFHELLESKFGDGSYDFIRKLYFHVAPAVSTIREQILKVIPLSALAERAPIVYNKEWNYGRLVVKTGRRQAVFQHFDWMPTPSFCALFHGAYEGILKTRGAVGTVTKNRCVRSGDDRCEYLVQW